MNIGASSPIKIVKTKRYIVDYTLLENSTKRLEIEVITNLDLTDVESAGTITTHLHSINGGIISSEILSTSTYRRDNIIDNQYAINNNYDSNIGGLNEYTYNITDDAMNDDNVEFKFSIKYLLRNSFTIIFDNLDLTEGQEIYISVELSDYFGEPNVMIYPFEGVNQKARKTRTIQIGKVVDISNGYENEIRNRYYISTPNKSLKFFNGVNYFDYTYSYSSSNSNITPSITAPTSNKVNTSNWGMYSVGNATLYLTNNTFKAKVSDLIQISSNCDDSELTPNGYSPIDAFRIRRNCDYNGVNYYNNYEPTETALVNYYYPSSKIGYQFSTDFTRKRNYEYYYNKVISDTFSSYINSGLLINIYTLEYDLYVYLLSNSPSELTTFKRTTGAVWIGAALTNSSYSVDGGGNPSIDTSVTVEKELMVNNTANSLDDISAHGSSYTSSLIHLTNDSIVSNSLSVSYTPLSKWKYSGSGTSSYSLLHPFIADFYAVNLTNVIYNNGINDDGVGATITATPVTTFPTNLYNSLGYYIPGVIVNKIVVVSFPSTASSTVKKMNGIYTVNNTGNATTPWVLTRHTSYNTNFDIIGSFVKVGVRFYENNKSTLKIGYDEFTYTEYVQANNKITSVDFLTYLRRNCNPYSDGRIYLSKFGYVNDVYDNTLRDYPHMPSASSANAVIYNIPNCLNIIDNPNCVKYSLELEPSSSLDTRNGDDISIGKSSISMNFNTTVAYSNFYVKRYDYKAYYNDSNVFQGDTSIGQLSTKVYDDTFVQSNAIKGKGNGMYGAYRMTSGIESLGFVQEKQTNNINTIIHIDNNQKTFILIPYLQAKYIIAGSTYTGKINNILKYNNKFWFEQVYRNIIKVPIFDISSKVYLKNIEIVSKDSNYIIVVRSFISSTVEDTNDTFMYEYLISVEINKNVIIDQAVLDYGFTNAQYNDVYIPTDYTLVFADEDGNEFRMKVKDMSSL